MIQKVFSFALLALTIFAGSQFIALERAEAADYWVAGNSAGDVYVQEKSIQWLDAENCIALIISVEKDSHRKDSTHYQYYFNGTEWYYMAVYEGGWSDESHPVASSLIHQRILEFLLTKRP